MILGLASLGGINSKITAAAARLALDTITTD
jgi:hypothetical protein